MRPRKPKSQDGNPCEAIRGLWEGAYVAQFLRLFQGKFGFTAVSTQELEEAIVDPLSLLVPDICARLLRLGLERKDILINNFEDSLWDYLSEHKTPSIPTSPESACWKDLGPTAKLSILKSLVDAVFEDKEEDLVDFLDDHFDADDLRGLRVGQDAFNNLYWYLNDLRLYRESNVKKNSKKEWECVCLSLSDWCLFLKQFRKTSNFQERELYNYLVNQLLPLIEGQLREEANRVEKRIQLDNEVLLQKERQELDIMLEKVPIATAVTPTAECNGMVNGGGSGSTTPDNKPPLLDSRSNPNSVGSNLDKKDFSPAPSSLEDQKPPPSLTNHCLERTASGGSNSGPPSVIEDIKPNVLELCGSVIPNTTSVSLPVTSPCSVGPGPDMCNGGTNTLMSCQMTSPQTRSNILPEGGNVGASNLLCDSNPGECSAKDSAAPPSLPPQQQPAVVPHLVGGPHSTGEDVVPPVSAMANMVAMSASTSPPHHHSLGCGHMQHMQPLVHCGAPSGPVVSGGQPPGPKPSAGTPAEAQYMQQQSQIFVFSTNLANKAAESVLSGQFSSIISFHCVQPGTKRILEKHPLKVQQFNRQSPAAWLNSMAQMKQGTRNMKGGMCGPVAGSLGVGSGSMMGGPPPMMPNQHQQYSTPVGPHPHQGMGGPHPPCGSGGPCHAHHCQPIPPQGGPLWHSNCPPKEVGPPWDAMPPQGQPYSSGGPPRPHMMGGGGLHPHPHSCRGGPHMMGDQTQPPRMGFGCAGQFEMNNHPPSCSPASSNLAGTKIPNENLTPQQLQHREEGLAKLRKMQQLLFLDQQGMDSSPQHHVQPQPPQQDPMFGSVSAPPLTTSAPGVNMGSTFSPQHQQLDWPSRPGQQPSQQQPPLASLPPQQQQPAYFDERPSSGMATKPTPPHHPSPSHIHSSMSSPLAASTPRPPPPYPPRSTSLPPSPSLSSPSPASSAVPSHHPASSLRPLQHPHPSPAGSTTPLNSPKPTPTSTPTPFLPSPSTSRSGGGKQPLTPASLPPSTPPSDTAASNSNTGDSGLFGFCGGQQQKPPGTPGTVEPSLMPVPSPQHIQYLNTFDGQELTIHKQPNTSIDSENSASLNTSLEATPTSVASAFPSVTTTTTTDLSTHPSQPGGPAMTTQFGAIDPQNPRFPAMGDQKLGPRFPGPMGFSSSPSGMEPRMYEGRHPCEVRFRGVQQQQQQQQHYGPSMGHPMERFPADVPPHNQRFKSHQGDGLRFPSEGPGGPAFPLDQYGSGGTSIRGMAPTSLGGFDGPGESSHLHNLQKMTPPFDFMPPTTRMGPHETHDPALCGAVAGSPHDHGALQHNPPPSGQRLSHFDPIASMAAMSETTSIPPHEQRNMNSSMNMASMHMVGNGGNHANMVNFNSTLQGVNSAPGGGFNPMAGASPQTVNNTYVNATMSIHNLNIQNMGPGAPYTLQSNGPPTMQASNALVQAPSSGKSPRNGTGMFMGPRGSIGARQPYNSIQVKVTAPNTIQYLPAPRVPQQAHPRPPADYVQRFNSLANLEGKVPTQNLQYFPNAAGQMSGGGLIEGPRMRVPGPHNVGGYSPGFQPPNKVMGLESQPLPPTGASSPYKPFYGPTTADPNYAVQFHNFQQQLYATNTRSQANPQGHHPPPSNFFNPK